MKKVVIFSSGTGGHVYPAYTLAEKYLSEGYDIIWVGTSYGLENKVVKNKKIQIEHIHASGFRGKNFLEKIKSIFYLGYSLYESFKILRNHRPCLIIGFGGYVSLSGILVSFIMRIPRIIHEQNAIAGTANKINYFLSNRVYETFPGSFKSLNNKILHTGNPVRSSFQKCRQPEEIYLENQFHLKILVMGGSLGSSFLNTTIPFALSHFPTQNLAVKHICGHGKLSNLQKKYIEYNLDAEVLEYSDNIDELFNWASLVVCRSGSTTISELASIGRACVLIPFPYATDDHQYKNAEYLSNNSAAITLKQSDDFIENLVTTLNFLLINDKRLYALAQNIKKVFPADPRKIIFNDSLNYMIDKNENS